MGDYTRIVKSHLRDHGCYFMRFSKGDHEIWYSPLLGKNFSIDGKIVRHTGANQFLKGAGVKIKV